MAGRNSERKAWAETRVRPCRSLAPLGSSPSLSLVCPFFLYALSPLSLHVFFLPSLSFLFPFSIVLSWAVCSFPSVLLMSRLFSFVSLVSVLIGCLTSLSLQWPSPIIRRIHWLHLDLIISCQAYQVARCTSLVVGAATARTAKRLLPNDRARRLGVNLTSGRVCVCVCQND